MKQDQFDLAYVQIRELAAEGFRSSKEEALVAAILLLAKVIQEKK